MVDDAGLLRLKAPAGSNCWLASNRNADRKGLSQHAFHICKKITEVDNYLAAQLSEQHRIRIVHPEVLFWALNVRKPLEHPKRTREGVAERLAILQRHFEAACDTVEYGRRVIRKSAAGVDDIIDALAGAVTGRNCRGAYQSLPTNPEHDERGLRMEMVYWTPD
jgi:predicted RNase H-like nuclease